MARGLGCAWCGAVMRLWGCGLAGRGVWWDCGVVGLGLGCGCRVAGLGLGWGWGCAGAVPGINKRLSGTTYADSMPLIPKEPLYASSAIHPEDHSMSWLLHTKVVPMQANSKQPVGSDGAAHPAQADV